MEAAKVFLEQEVAEQLQQKKATKALLEQQLTGKGQQMEATKTLLGQQLDGQVQRMETTKALLEQQPVGQEQQLRGPEQMQQLKSLEPVLVLDQRLAELWGKAVPHEQAEGWVEQAGVAEWRQQEFSQPLGHGPTSSRYEDQVSTDTPCHPLSKAKHDMGETEGRPLGTSPV